MSGRILRKTEAVAANHNSVLQDHVVPDLAEFTDHRMCVGEKVVTNLHAAIHDHMREQYSVLADFHAVLNYHVRSNVGAVADLGRRMHNRSRMYSRRISRRLIKKFQRTRKIQIRIFAAQHRRTESREVFSDNHSRRFGCPRCRGIFRVGYESNLSWAGGFNSRNAVDFGIWRAILQPSTQPPIDLRKFHFADDCKGRVAANRGYRERNISPRCGFSLSWWHFSALSAVKSFCVSSALNTSIQALAPDEKDRCQPSFQPN